MLPGVPQSKRKNKNKNREMCRGQGYRWDPVLEVELDSHFAGALEGMTRCLHPGEASLHHRSTVAHAASLVSWLAWV